MTESDEIRIDGKVPIIINVDSKEMDHIMRLLEDNKIEEIYKIVKYAKEHEDEDNV